MACGWLAEVERLHAAGHHSGMQAMQAIGYRHLLAYLEQGADFATTVQEIERDIRRFAKRQLTWFRNRTGFSWLIWSNQQQWQQVVAHLGEAGRNLLAASG